MANSRKEKRHPRGVPSELALACDVKRDVECLEGECRECRTDGGGVNGQGLPVVCDRELGRGNRAKTLEMRGRSIKENWDLTVSRFVAMTTPRLHENETVTWTASSCIGRLKVVCLHHCPEHSRGDGGDGDDDDDERRIDGVGLRAPPGMQRSQGD